MFTDFADYLSAMDPDAPLLGVAHLNCWDEDDDDVASEDGGMDIEPDADEEVVEDVEEEYFSDGE